MSCVLSMKEILFKLIEKHWRKDAALSDTLITVIKEFTSLETMFNGSFCFGIESVNQVITCSSNFVSE